MNFVLVIKDNRGWYLTPDYKWSSDRKNAWTYQSVVAFHDQETYGGTVFLETATRCIEITKADWKTE